MVLKITHPVGDHSVVDALGKTNKKPVRQGWRARDIYLNEEPGGEESKATELSIEAVVIGIEGKVVHVEEPANKQFVRNVSKEKENRGETEREREKERETDRQTGIQTYRKREREREREINTIRRGIITIHNNEIMQIISKKTKQLQAISSKYLCSAYTSI